MKDYTVQKHYSSAWGVLVRGETVKLDDETAAWLLRDSPGVIAEVVKARAVEAPPKTRQVTKPPAKRAVTDDGE